MQYIGKDGKISHNHSSLLFLKKVKKEELPSEIREYAGIVSCMMQGKYSLDFFLFEFEKKIKGDDTFDDMLSKIPFCI